MSNSPCPQTIPFMLQDVSARWVFPAPTGWKNWSNCQKNKKKNEDMKNDAKYKISAVQLWGVQWEVLCIYVCATVTNRQVATVGEEWVLEMDTVWLIYSINALLWGGMGHTRVHHRWRVHFKWSNMQIQSHRRGATEGNCLWWLKKEKKRSIRRLHRSSCVSSTFIFYSIALLSRDPSGDYPSASDDPAPLFYWGLSVLCAVRKAMPWVLKWVLRSVALSNRRPHTLQPRFPSPSSPCAWGEPAAGEPSGEPWARGVPRSASLWVSRTRWVMKRCLLREPADAKQTPHCRHWKEAVSPRCWGMWRWNSAPSSVVNPQGTQRKTLSSSSASLGPTDVDAMDALVLFAGPPPSSVLVSSSSPALAAGGPTSPSCSEELPGPSPPVAARFLVIGGPWEKGRAEAKQLWRRYTNRACPKNLYSPVHLCFCDGVECVCPLRTDCQMYVCLLYNIWGVIIKQLY